jgi:hypothetical protein
MRKQKVLNILTIEGMEAWQGYLSNEKRELLIKSWAGTFRLLAFGCRALL